MESTTESLPRLLPQWQCTNEQQPEPVIRQVDKVNLGRDTLLRFENEPYGSGSLWIYFGYGRQGWPEHGTDAERRLATLRHVVAEMERTLPILRKLEAEAAAEGSAQ